MSAWRFIKLGLQKSTLTKLTHCRIELTVKRTLVEFYKFNMRVLWCYRVKLWYIQIVSFCNLLFQFDGPRESGKWREMVWRSPLTFPPTRQPSKTLHTLAGISNSLMTTCTTVCIDTMSHNSSTSRRLKHKENQVHRMGKGQKTLQVGVKKDPVVIECCVRINLKTRLYWAELIFLPAQRSNSCRSNPNVTINSIKNAFFKLNPFP